MFHSYWRPCRRSKRPPGLQIIFTGTKRFLYVVTVHSSVWKDTIKLFSTIDSLWPMAYMVDAVIRLLSSNVQVETPWRTAECWLLGVCIVYFEFNIKYSRLNRKDWEEIFPAMSRVTSRLVSCQSTALLLHIRINIFLQRFGILLQGRMCWSSSALSLWLVSNVSYWLWLRAEGYHLDRAIWLLLQ